MNYEVSFYKKSDETKKKEKDEYLGRVEIDDFGVGPGHSLTAKAFRQADPKCLLANKVRVKRIVR